ncbi:MAG: hypothetical protein AB7O86_14525 [Porticoccaceae bacterium]
MNQTDYRCTDCGASTPLIGAFVCPKCRGIAAAYCTIGEPTVYETYKNNALETGTEKPKRRVVCAAIRSAEGNVIVGIRHTSPDMNNQIILRTGGERFYDRPSADYGFIDQYGIFLTAEEAYKVALAAGQIQESVRLLRTEDLY